MCGINGIVSLSGAPIDASETKAITAAMARRGPDGEGFVDLGSVQLGHRRLAIVDLTDFSSQPLRSHDGRFVIAFNGEIYNYQALREELLARGSRFSSKGDTEVIVEAYRHFGEGCVGRLRGMFAFGIWDTHEQSLFLARDPLGIKPLCIARTREHLRFASSARALLLASDVDAQIDDAALSSYLAWGHVPEPATLFRGITMLPAGSTLTVRAQRVGSPQRFWRVGDLWRSPMPAATPHSFREAALGTVSAHLVGDVKVGVFLSAGIDSSALLGLATEVQGRAQTAITLGFDEFAGTHSDEVPLATRIAAQFGAEHHVSRITLDDVEQLIPEFVEAMDSPSTDGLNSFLVTRAARRLGLKCTLSGMGGDELFGGYPVMHRFATMERVRARVPRAAWRLASAVAAPSAAWRREKVRYVADAMRAPESLYHLLRGVRTPDEVAGRMGQDRFRAAGGLEAILQPVRTVWQGVPEHPWVRVVTAEFALYLRNQLLRDSDWASMWHGVELRVPYVDRTFLEACAANVVAARGAGGKRLLAEAPSPALPTAVARRPKTGFSLPMSSWTVRAIRNGLLQMPSFLALGEPRRDSMALADQVERGELHWSRAWSLTVLDRYVRPRQRWGNA